MTDEELLVEKKELKKSRIIHAALIGFLAGILIFGIVAWLLSPQKHWGFLIPMLIPITIVYRKFKNQTTMRI
jgi:hypothetical protein